MSFFSVGVNILKWHHDFTFFLITSNFYLKFICRRLKLENITFILNTEIEIDEFI